uniref:Ig-like domain-containing protein n=1 Tax=Caenorhabditis japonica TaxID=281687 RepID=A0A8R1DLX3_CAEJA
MLVLAVATFISLALAHPPMEVKMHEAVGMLVNQIDKAQLTSKPILRMSEVLKDVKGVAGDKIVLRCEATTTPAAVFHWTFNGKRVQGDKDLNVYEKVINIGKPTVESGIVASTYTIPCASQADVGNYKCIAYNGHTTIESSAEVSIEGEEPQCKSNRRTPPTIVQYTDSRFEMEGNTGTLVCRTDRLATIAWTFEGEILNNSEEKYEVMPNGDLLVKRLEWSDMGTYECIASNKYGEDRVETFLYPSKKKVTVQ